MTIDISKFKSQRILVVGDLVIDEFIYGEVESYTDEAPVPVVSVSREYSVPGGAGNVARNISSSGAATSVIGLTGEDSGSRMLLDAFTRYKIDRSGIHTDSSLKTMRKTRIISSCQQVAQLERDGKIVVSVPVESAMIMALRKKISEADLVVVCDQNRGTLTKAFLTELFFLAKKHDVTTVVAPGGSGYEKYNGATYLVPSLKALARETCTYVKDRTGLLKAASKLLKTVRIDAIAVFNPRKGCVVFEKSLQPVFIESEKREVFDETGVHDTLVAVIGLALSSGGSFKDAVTVANVAAGIVIEKTGSASITEREMVLELMAFSGRETQPSESDPFIRKQVYY